MSGGRGQRAAQGPATTFWMVINAYFSTLMPIERAVPAMIFSAASIVVAFRSGILVCAMSRTWAALMLPTLVLCGSALPLSTPAAFLISSGAGGVFVMKVHAPSA